MTKTTALLNWNSYRYFPYEKELAQREVSALLKPVEVAVADDGLQVSGEFKSTQLKRLVYFGGYRVNGKIIPTLQNNLESSCTVTGSQKRQSTRYSVHGMHEYKGKFNPQVVRGVLNILGATPNSRIIDPFCGSGTSLVECAHVGMTAIGCDMNPLAVYITNTKLKALATPEETLRTLFLRLVDKFEKQEKKNYLPVMASDNERAEYLWNWFDKETLSNIEYLKLLAYTVTSEHSNIFLVLVSDLLRDYSLQEPTDLRIRRRYSPFPQQPFWEAFKRKALQFLDNLSTVQQVIGVRKGHSRAYLCDSRALDTAPKFPKPSTGYHAAITSPPYATALPYIDTQRLSLVWLGLISPKEIGYLEARLTGSREFIQEQKKLWGDSLANNSRRLPDNIYKYCLKLKKAVSSKDGFRRKSVPMLMYRYLSDMRDVFKSTLGVMQASAPFALIVGHNRTNLDGKDFDIDTPALLREVALECGWLHEDSIPLQTYQRYGSHMANAVQAETLLIVRKP
jgi:site-specific DNA-methyltransferase (cytosine-N4-specific)